MMNSPWIENYRGEWENCEGFRLSIRPINEKTAFVDIEANGRPVPRPWCADSVTNDLDALYRGEEGLGLEVNLGRDGFALFLDFESAGSIFEKECLTAGVSRWQDDDEAEQWTSIFGVETYLRRE